MKRSAVGKIFALTMLAAALCADHYPGRCPTTTRADAQQP